MRVVYQDCGCVALPDEVVTALGLVPGSVIDFSIDSGSQVAMMAAGGAIDSTTEKMPGASCRIRAVGA